MVRQILKITFAFILFGIWIENSIAIPMRGSPVIYADPLFGGEENGPVLSQKYLGKTITLDLAKKLCTMLQERDIVCILSREQDSFLSSGERILRARERAADAYIAINLVKHHKNCIHISYQNRLSKPDVKGREDAGRVLFEIKGGKILEDSTALARSIRDKMKGNFAVNCAVAEGESTYLLENSFIPTVVITFQVRESGSVPPYVIDPVAVDKILNAVASAVEKYLKEYKFRGSKGTKGDGGS